ncbi:MAG: hypothetical protein QGI05_05180, partial [Candidatus Omnitrophota bacterium]|nr:hypothetical protein [Candidatus Omnitrophota bacterium]
MSNKVKYHIDSNGEFVIENYNLAGTFSNFLPGIAGLFGIPMWAFYVNRAQAVCSFGVKSKDSPLMEFLPANRAYQLVSSQGFRTFIKIKNNKNRVFYEPFQASYHGATRPVQKMFISPYELRLLEIAPDLGLEVEVTYFTIPNESFAALARRVTLKNTSRKDLSIEVLDGTPLLIPYGVSNFFLQKMRRTVEAWMIVENVGKNAPYYRLKVNPNDISEVSFIEEGNFYLASLNTKGRKKDDVLPVVVDPDVIFGQVKDFSSPVNFIDQTKFKVPPSQIGQNKLPSAMSLASFRLKKGETSSINSLMGHMSSKDKLNSLAPTIRKEQFFIEKRDENKGIIRDIQKDIFTSSGEKKYDLYCGQTFLDNVLRGGYPISCCDHSRTFHVYSRKHGDLERDYNRYFIDPTYFSQGNGNFRDMNQNRRSDVFFNPDVGDSNILHFYNLIQTDGFNPLVLRGVRFKLKPDLDLKITLKGKIEEKYIKKLEGILIDSFTLGELFMNLEKFTMKLESSWQEFLSEILKNCDTIYDAEHGEGFWVDHWTYNLDLVENYLAIYPEKLKEILLDKKEFTFYDNVFCIKPRDKRHVINGNNGVRQYHSLARDEEKESLIKKRTSEPHIVRVANGEGQIYKTNLLVKMLCLTINKLASLDPFGIGIEMEADKPGWCDSLNGLPGLLGSSTPEVFELYRQIVFILDALKALKLDDTCKIPIPKELHDFLKGIESLIKTLKRMSAKKKDFNYWDKSNSLKETYRLKTKLGF